MSLKCVSASSMRIENTTTPIAAYPFTVGFWTKPTTLQFSYPFSNVDMGVDNTSFYMLLTQSPNFAWQAGAQNGGSVESATTGAGQAVVNQWSYVVGRWISATNRRTATINSNGSAAHVQFTTNLTPTSIDRMILGTRNRLSGSTSPYDGLIAEFWCTNTDIQPDGAQLDDDMLRQLAYGGPFSVPHIVKDIVEYRSLRVVGESRGDQLGEVYFGAKGRQTWSNVNGPTTGEHPPLPYWYQRPRSRPFVFNKFDLVVPATGAQQQMLTMLGVGV